MTATSLIQFQEKTDKSVMEIKVKPARLSLLPETKTNMADLSSNTFSCLVSSVSSSCDIKRGSSSLLLDRAEWRPLSVHRWGETTWRRAVLPRQPVLPLSQHTTGKMSNTAHKHTHLQHTIYCDCSTPDICLFMDISALLIFLGQENLSFLVKLW